MACTEQTDKGRSEAPQERSPERLTEWLGMETAPRDGQRIKAKGPLRVRVRQMPGSILPGWRMRMVERVTWWGKTSHVPLYGWCHGRDPEDIDLWQPTRWKPCAGGTAGEGGCG